MKSFNEFLNESKTADYHPDHSPGKDYKKIDVHDVLEGEDDHEPLYQVHATLHHSNGSKRSYRFDWVRKGHLHALKHPKAKGSDGMLKDLMDRNDHTEVKSKYSGKD